MNDEVEARRHQGAAAPDSLRGGKITLQVGDAYAFYIRTNMRIMDEHGSDAGARGLSAGQSAADGPLTRVELPDGQILYAVVVSRRREHDGSWWYTLRIHLPSATETRKRMVMEPAPVEFRAPSGLCEPVVGQSYDEVPTTRHGRVDGRWRIELPWDRGDAGPDGPARIVHRGDCRMVSSTAKPVNDLEAQIALHRDAVPCAVCRPDRALNAM